MDTLCGRITVSAIVGVDYTTSLVILARGRQEKLQDYPKVRKRSNAASETFVSIVAHTTPKAVPSIEFQTSKGYLEREEVVKDTMSDLSKKNCKNEMHLPRLRKLEATLCMKTKKNLLMRNFLRLSPMRVRDTLATDTKSEKGIISSQRSNCEVCKKCKKTKATRARCTIKPKKRVDGIAPSERGKRQHAPIVQGGFTNWIQSCPLKNERHIGDNVVFTKISSSVTEAGKN